MQAMSFVNLIDQFLVISHVVAGGVALVAGPLAMLTAKGSLAHRRSGKTYAICMLWISLSTFALLLFRWNFFLFGIASLTGYLTFSGYRATKRKGTGVPTASKLDWLAGIVATLIGVGFIAWSIANLLGWITTRTGPEQMAVPSGFLALAIVFGYLLCVNSIPDLISFRRPSHDRNWWWFMHMNRMVGAFIGTLSAFLVQNVAKHFPVEQSWVIWIAPTVIGLPLLALWIRHYRQKFAQQADTAPKVNVAGKRMPSDAP
jgi:uncharacterized membrane protein